MAAIDKFAGKDLLDGPAEDGELVTPSDVNELTQVSRALYVGGAGDLRVKMLDGTDLTFTGVPAGTLLPVRVKQVLATDTTATAIIALW